MLSRMAPSSPPDMRTLHLLRTPDILCANDTRQLVSYISVNSIEVREHHAQVGGTETPVAAEEVVNRSPPQTHGPSHGPSLLFVTILGYTGCNRGFAVVSQSQLRGWAKPT